MDGFYFTTGNLDSLESNESDEITENGNGKSVEYLTLIGDHSGNRLASLIKTSFAATEYSLWDMIKFASGSSFTVNNIVRNEKESFWNTMCGASRR